MNELPVIFQELATSKGQRIGIASLNDPNALNALSLEMIDVLHLQLICWAKQEDIVCIILKGEGDKAFCAGGNIRNLYTSILESNYGKNPYAESFFSKEYRLDYLIHKYPKPIVCLGQGFVMGGGIGLMTGASHRIVSESSVLAMPEITIGLFPDVGSSWFLSRMPEGLGGFIGMTGARMNAADAIFAGLADYYLPNQQINNLETSLCQLDWKKSVSENNTLVSQLLQQLSQPYKSHYPVSKLQKYHEDIKKIIVGHSPDDVLTQLVHSDNPWLNKCAKTLQRGCPATAWIVKEQIRYAASMSLEDIFKMELNIAIQCTRYKDFCEGIRALLIDRDNCPQWEDSSLNSVPQEKIALFFTPHWEKDKHPLHDIQAVASSLLWLND